MKAIILRHDSPISHSYAEIAAKSCDDVDLSCEYHEGFSNMAAANAWNIINEVEIKNNTNIEIETSKNKAALCTLSHVAIWKKIIQQDEEEIIILEHDAIMLYKPTIKIPDNTIVALGYKISDPNKYNHKVAGPPKMITAINKFHGSHAYAITKNTAQQLFDNVKKHGTAGCIDTHWFRSDRFRKPVALAITDPICALGWLRKSTIWGSSSHQNNITLQSFQGNY